MIRKLSCRPATIGFHLFVGITGVLTFHVLSPQHANANEYALGPQRPDIPAIGEVDFVEPDVMQSKNGVLDIHLTAVLVDQEGKVVECSPAPLNAEYYRAYLASDLTPDPISPKSTGPTPDLISPKPTGPTLKFAPGDIVRILLNNEMCEGDDEHANAMFRGNPPQVLIDRNQEHGINHTNLHTHGLWVSPTGNSDNVLIGVAPGQKFQFEYLIPKDHVPGTHWYHPHKHGSVKTQVQTGMSGALIMTGGIDEIEAVKQANDRVMVVQKFNSSKQPRAMPKAPLTANEMRFPEDDVTTINGVRAPTIKKVEVGHTERWRIVSAIAGSRLNIWVEMLNNAGENQALCKIKSAPGSAVYLHPIAYDGIPVKTVHRWSEIRLYPGNRADLMLRFDEPGDYVICNNAWNGKESDFGPIGYVKVIDTGSEGGPKMPIPRGFAKVFLYDDLLYDHDVLLNARQVLFSENYGKDFSNSVRIDNKQFDPNRVDQRIPLDAKQEWILKNDSAYNTKNDTNSFHPFHIHVNPFQLVASSDPIYSDPRMKGVWLDVVGIPGSSADEAAVIDSGQTRHDRRPGYVTIRSHFKRFIGRYVIHCHILGHEDAGMMQIVEVY